MGLENLTSIHVFQNQYRLDPSWAKSMGVEGSMSPAFYSMILSSLIYRDPFQCTVVVIGSWLPPPIKYFLELKPYKARQRAKWLTRWGSSWVLFT